MSRSLDDLSTDLRPKAFELLARLTERKVHVLIVSTLRTMEEHQANLKAGTSATTFSKHLPRKLRPTDPGPHVENLEKSDAMDLAPLEPNAEGAGWHIDWSTDHPAWAVIGELAEGLGLRWGGRWKTPHDPGHVEWVAQK